MFVVAVAVVRILQFPLCCCCCCCCCLILGEWVLAALHERIPGPFSVPAGLDACQYFQNALNSTFVVLFSLAEPEEEVRW